MTARLCLRSRLRRLPAATEGIAAVEFGLVAPVFFLMLMGIYDLGQMIYGRVELEGAVQAAARSSSLETGDTGAADRRVMETIAPVLPGARVVEVERMSYYDFADIDRPEKWNDANENGTCDNGESYVDENRSGAWEPDVGREDNGGAGDVVVYRYTIAYKPLFPVPFTGAHQGERQMSAVAVKKNQPYALQQGLGSSAGKCE